MQDSQLKQRLEAASHACLQRARPLFHGVAQRPPEIAIEHDLRGKTAGQVRLRADGRMVVRYNLAMARLQPQHFIEQTVPHEMAHVVVYRLHGRAARPHGAEWRAVMAFFGIAEPQRCHGFELPDTPQRRQRRWPYQCACDTHLLSTTRHNRIRDGIVYHCRRCGDMLRPGPVNTQ